MMNVNDWGPQSKVYYVTFELKCLTLALFMKHIACLKNVQKY